MGFGSSKLSEQLDENTPPPDLKPDLLWWSRVGSTLAALGSWTAALMTRFEAIFVLASVVEYLAVQARTARRPLWFDELFTFYIARLPDLSLLFRALPGDGNPPLNYLLARLSLELPGAAPAAVRIPSILAWTAALLSTYYFVRRRCGPVPGLLSMLALASTGVAVQYGSEARPYALLLGFTGLTLVSWQAATEAKRARFIPLAGMTLCIAGAIASHHYGAIHVGVPLIFGEGIRLVRRRRLDIPLYAAAAAGFSMLVFTLPIASATHQVMLDYVKQSASFWAKPTISHLRSYTSMVCVWLPFVLLPLLLMIGSHRPDKTLSGNTGPPSHEVAAASGLALLVPIMIVLTWLATGYYMERYAIGAAVGIALLMGFSVPLLGRDRNHGIGVAALCVVVLGASPLVVNAIEHRRTKAPPFTLDAFAGPGFSREPIVVASALTFMPEWWYASPQLRERLHYLADLPFAVRQPDFLPELSLVVNQSSVPSKADDYRQFVSTHYTFLLYSIGEPNLEWTVTRLVSEGWSLQVISMYGKATLYLATSPGNVPYQPQ